MDVKALKDPFDCVTTVEKNDIIEMDPRMFLAIEIETHTRQFKVKIVRNVYKIYLDLRNRWEIYLNSINLR